ncbi:MAG: carboxypeptidase-like regulatory domain-containing protein [Flavobacterium psychrophilum]
MKKVLGFALFFLSIMGFAQTVRVEGLITDAQQTPLEMANIMAVRSSTKDMDGYAITNDKGKFQLQIKANTAYVLKVSYLGMQSKEITLTTAGVNLTQNISLEAEGIELKGVEIVREMPVSIKGDTIIYNADSFKTGTERKLEDVLKKLPGVEVNANGEVEVEGKKVTKLMVEGKDFFDGDTKLGVKNIPADAIDKIQVLRNYNEISALKGVENNNEDVAMNIKLKKGKKNFWFGDAQAGIGVARDDSRFIVNPKLFYYSPEYSINLLANFNNLGELPFTPQDYFKFTGGFKNVMKKGGTNFNVSSNDLGISLMQNNRAKAIETQFGATNFSYTVTKSWNISGFAIGSSTLTDLETQSQVNRVDNANLQQVTRQKTLESTHQKSNLGLFKLSSTYKPSAKLQFDYDVLLKTSAQQEMSQLSSETTTPFIVENQTINTQKKQDPISVQQNANWYYTPTDKQVFAVEIQHLYQNENPFYNTNLGVNPFPDSLIPEQFSPNLGLVDEPSGRYDLNQNRFVKTNKTDAKFDYYYSLTPKTNLNITTGYLYTHQNFNSNLFQLLDNGSTNGLNDNSKNRVRFQFNDAYVGVHFKWLVGKLTVNPGFSVHQYYTQDSQLGLQYQTSFTRILPDVYALYQLKKSETLTYNYSVTTDFTDIKNLAEGYVLSNYNALFRGTRYLENALLQNHSLRYFRYNLFNFTTIFGFVNYSRKVNAIKTEALFTGMNQFSTPYNSNFPDETLSSMFNYGRSFGHLKASVNASVNWSKFYNIRLQSVVNVTRTPIVTESITQSYTGKLGTNYKNAPNLELGYTLAVNDYQSSTFYTEKPFAKLDYYFWDAFSFVAEYEFYQYSNNDKTIRNTYDFLTAKLQYQQKDKPWEFELSGTNLLNTTSLNDDSFTQFQTRTSQYQVQPRYVVFSIKYHL